jgi:hypothetical protein
MRGLALIALLWGPGCELAIQPDRVPPPGARGAATGPHALRSGRLVAAGSDAGVAGPAGAHAIHAGSLGPARTPPSRPGSGHWIREGRVDP